MKNLAVIAIATFLSASAFAQKTKPRQEARPDVVTEQMRGNITAERARLTTDAARGKFDEMRAAIGDFSMATVAPEFVRTLTHPKLEASDSTQIDLIISGARAASADISQTSISPRTGAVTATTASQRSHVKTAINNTILSQLRILTETSGEYTDPVKFNDVTIEIGKLAKAGNIQQAVHMANELTRLNGVVLARTNRNGGDLYKGLRDTAAEKAMLQIATEYGITALNPAAIIDGNKVLILENGKPRPFDAEKDVLGDARFKKEVFDKFMAAWRKVLECMGGVRRAA